MSIYGMLNEVLLYCWPCQLTHTFSTRHDQYLCVSDVINVPCRKCLPMECWMKFCCTVDPVNSPTHIILCMDHCPIVCPQLLCLPFTERFSTAGYMTSSTGENKPMLNRQLTCIKAEFLHTTFKQNVHVVLGIALHVHCTETFDSRKCWLHMKFWMWRKKDIRKGNMRLTNPLNRTCLRSLLPSDNVVSVL
jgi:hypothetical protein